MTQLRVAIVGGGIGGLAAAIASRKAGHDASVYERRSQTETGGGAMLIWSNGAAALESFGLAEAVLGDAQDIARVEFRTAAGAPIATWTVDAARGGRIRIVVRTDLLRALRSRLPDSSVHEEHAVSGFLNRRDELEVQFAGGLPAATADVLVGADGVHSRVRAQLFGEPPAPTVHQLGWFAIVHHDDSAMMPPGVAIATIGDGRRFCAARVDAERVYWYSTLNANRRPSVAGAQGLAAAFEGWHRLVGELILAGGEGITGPIVPTDRPPLRHWGRGRVTLLGDSAHVCLPDLSQGAGQALESAAELGAFLTASGPVEDALRRYEICRRTSTERVIGSSRLVAAWSMSEAVHVKTFRDFGARHLLPLVGFPMMDRMAQRSVH